MVTTWFSVIVLLITLLPYPVVCPNWTKLSDDPTVFHSMTAEFSETDTASISDMLGPMSVVVVVDDVLVVVEVDVDVDVVDVVEDVDVVEPPDVDVVEDVGVVVVVVVAATIATV